ncbi:MAG: sodium:solute symporter family protein [Dehalobacterium sp.]
MNFLLVLPTIVAVIVAFGVVEYYSQRATDVESYYVSNRGTSTLLLTGTYVASWVSITGMVGMASSAFRMGIAWNQWTWGFWGVVFFTFLVGLPLRKLCTRAGDLAPLTREGVEANSLLTPSDFFQLRFPSKWVRGISAVMLLVGLTFYAVGQLIGVSLALTAIGFNYGLGLLLLMSIVIYTTIRGGTPGIIVNDTINMFVFIFAVIILFPFAIKSVGGIDHMVTVSSQLKPGMWSNMGHKNTLIAIISFNLVWNFMTAGSPHLVQRAYTAKDERTFLKAQVIGVAIVIMWCWVLYTATQTGLVFFPTLEGTAVDNILPMVATHVLPTLLAGLIIASIFAVGFSTVNTQISNLAFSWVRDVYQTLINPQASEEKMMRNTKWAVAVCALITAFFAWIRPGFIYEITAWGIAFYGAAFVPMFVFGLFWKRATTQGIITGISLSSIVFIALGLLKLTGIYTLPGGMHAFFVSMPVSVFTIVVVSLLTKQSEHERTVAENISAVLSEKSTRPVRASDFAVPIGVIAACLIFGGVWATIF